MKTLTIFIKPLEPLMFRGSGEFDPSARGVFSYAESKVLPSPSTIAGFLCSLILELYGNSTQRKTKGSWLEELSTISYILDLCGINRIIGPYLVDTKKYRIYVPLRLGKLYGVIDLNQIYYYLSENKLVKLLITSEYYEKKEKILKKLIKNNSILEKIIIFQERMGVGLKTRAIISSKTAFEEEGLLYSARYVSYLNSVMLAVSILFKENKSKEKFIEVLEEGVPAKIGGEHRISNVTISEGSILKEFLELKGIKQSRYAILLTPHLVKTYNELTEIKDQIITGVIDITGLGFSINTRKRKPIYIGLLEGSVLKLKKKVSILSSTYDIYTSLSEDYKILSRIGYGSLVPIGE